MLTRQGLRFVALVLLATSFANADDTASLMERLHRADLGSSLNSEGFPRWHLKLDVQLFGEKGELTEQGSIEEWWTSPSEFRITYATPSYHAVEEHATSGLRRTKDAGSPPAILQLLLREASHPMPPQAEIDSSVPDLRKQKFGSVPLDCIMLDQKIKMAAYPPFGLFPTYCFDPGETKLRIVYEVGNQAVIFNKLGHFRDRSVATEITVKELNRTTAITHIVNLESKADLAPPPLDPASLVPFGEAPAPVDSMVMRGKLINQPQPIYPESARVHRISGSVVIRAIIGTDGHIHSMRLVSVPDPDLAIAALAAVRQWIYSPYMLNGEAKEVDTTVTVNFELRKF